MITSRCRLLSVVSIAGLALGSSTAPAETLLVSNLSEPFRANTPIANPEFWAAQSFATGSGECRLNSILVIAGNGQDDPLVVAELRAPDIDGEIDLSPGGLLATFSAPDLSGPTSARLFVPDSDVVLPASQTVWFVLGSANAGKFDWSYADTNNSIGPGSLGNYADSSDAGASWTYRGNDFPYFIEVNCSAPRGACCRPGGTCIPDIDAFNCQVEFGGTYLGDNAECTAGACCSDPLLLLLSNLEEPFRASTPIAFPEFWAAQAFMTDGTDRVLVSIEAVVGNGANAPQVVAELRRSDINGGIDATPGGLVTTCSPPDMSGPTTARVFTPDTPVTLLAFEQYWFALGSANQGTFDWSYADSNFFAGPGILGNFADSSDAGMNWTLGDGSFPYFIQVTVECGGADADSDGDTVPDTQDQCPNTVPGAIVDATGCPPLIRFDFDRDGDVDQLDLKVFDGCGSGPAILHGGGDDCLRSDPNSDGDVDGDDFGAFQRCYSGSGQPAEASGACALCVGGGTWCSGVCTNLAFDPSNCGACGNVCAGGETCSGGICQSPW